MSICIAAVCEAGDVLITASDRLLTWGHTTTEQALKDARLTVGWSIMVAGDDITVAARDVIREARETLAAYGDKNPSLLEVKAAVVGAWRECQNQVGAAAVLNPYGLTVQEFLKSRERLGDTLFLELARQLEPASRLHCQLLVAGFDERRKVALLAQDDEFGCRDFTDNHFVAIGSGHHTALASLAFHDYDHRCSATAAVYHVCAAKFMAEGAPGVGKRTMVFLHHQDGSQHWISARSVDKIRALWEKSGRPQIPSNRDINRTTDRNLKEDRWLMPSKERMASWKIPRIQVAPRSLRFPTRGRKPRPPSQG